MQGVFFIWGIGILLPWNTVLSAFDFFASEMTGYQPAFVYPFAVNVLTIVTQVLMLFHGHRLPDSIKV